MFMIQQNVLIKGFANLIYILDGHFSLGFQVKGLASFDLIRCSVENRNIIVTRQITKLFSRLPRTYLTFCNS